jgi:hypothetical protein
MTKILKIEERRSRRLSLSNLQLDAATMKAGALAFISLAEAGAAYVVVYEALRSAGVHGNATHAFIEWMERQTGRQLGGERPAIATGLERTAAARAINARVVELDRAKRAARYVVEPGRMASTGSRVVACEICGAPVVDSVRGRLGHAVRMGHKQQRIT